MAVAKMGYRTWVAMYLIALCLSIGFPIFAIIVDGDIWAKVFAGVAAIAASLSAAFRPGEKATAYDRAVQILWAARIAFISNKNADAFIGEIKRAQVLMQVTYADGEEKNGK